MPVTGEPFFYLNKVQTFGAVPWYDKALNPDDPDLNKRRDSREFIMAKVLEDITFAATNIYETKDTYSSLVNRFTALAMKSRICLYEGTYRKYHTELGLTDANTWLKAAADAAQEVINSGQYRLYNTGKPENDYRALFTAEDLAGMPKNYWRGDLCECNEQRFQSLARFNLEFQLGHKR